MLAVVALACGTAVVEPAPPSSAAPLSQARRPGVALAASDTPARLRLPLTTGHYPVGTVSLHLIDRSRPNPWAASPRYRELMVSIWYPARDVLSYPVVPQMLPGAAAHFGSSAGAGFQLYQVPPGKVDWAATNTSGHQGAPMARPPRPLSVLLYSPGAEDPKG